MPVSSMCGGRSATDGSNPTRPRAASAPCRSKQSRSRHSSNFPLVQAQTFSFHRSAAPTSDLHNFRTREWKPAQLAAGITPIRRVYDLRHTFATFALRAGVSTFDLSRYMGASLTMIDRHYGHLARDGRDHAIDLLDTHASADEAGVHRVDIAWTLHQQAVASAANQNSS